MAALPQWGEKIDRQVQTYIQGVQNVVRANLNWRYGILWPNAYRDRRPDVTLL
jgi:hypothetical protein